MSDPDSFGDGISRRRTVAGLLGVGSAASALAQGGTPAAPASVPPPSLSQKGPSVLDYGADSLGRNDSSAAFKRAFQELNGGRLIIPPGRYLVQNIGGLGPAGQQIVGESRWKSVLSSEAGGGSIFANEVAGRGTSAYHLLSDFSIDLNGNDAIAIDLASINCTTVQRLHIRGGSDSRYNGTGVRFAAPIERGAYDNAVHDCSFEYLDRAIVWGDGANNNTISNCRVIKCNIGLHAAPAKLVDTPRVFGGRVEGCRIGLLEGAESGGYFAVRFEANLDADIRFTAQSRYTGIWGGSTATTRLVISDLDKALSPTIDSGELGAYAIEESASRPKVSTGRHIFAPPGKAPTMVPQGDYAVFFEGRAIFRNAASLEFAPPTGDGAIVGILANEQGELAIPGFNSRTRTFATINLGGGPAVQPLTNAVTSLGSPQRNFRAGYFSDGLVIGGQPMLAARTQAIANDRSRSGNTATVNAILAVLRHHGLIEE